AAATGPVQPVTQDSRRRFRLADDERSCSTVDPAPIHVDCAGPVREDVPGDGFLGEGLTGEDDRLKRGLQRRAPTIPLLGLGSGWGGVLGVSVAVRIGLLGEVAVNGALQ